MEFDIRYDCADVDWKDVQKLLKSAGMAYHSSGIHKKAFEASHTTVFVYNSEQLIGIGRAISDGSYQAAIYDCAVLPEFQGKGIGKIIMKSVLAHLSHCNIILYASPGKEGFYKKLGFRKMKTGMGRFIKSDLMQERGFIE
ncbi:MAG: GNAT family N-acetyltransferase [Deltaproteobacteria bacterium]|nr:GNAT family N-acetyltransferase [Deltaproteobacteria bacterium]